MTNWNYEYKGTIYPLEKDPAGTKDDRPYPYLPGEELIEAVNLAIDLKRPLLLEGDPGCGKTCLAEAIAYEFKQTNGNGTDWPIYRFDVKSATRGKDVLYRWDAVGRLRDAQMLGANLSELGTFLDPKDFAQLKTRLKDRTKYLEMGALGKAIQEPAKRAIVLLDEVDKADSDFANDLLLELDRFQFSIPELGEDAVFPKDPKTAPKPIVILTSNREKPLPAPFLRRCIYFYVPFPDRESLRKIVEHRPDIPKNREVVEQAIDHIEEIRAVLENVPGSRAPGTSEFLDFLAALLRKKDPKKAMEDLQNLANRRPLLGILLKTESDQQRYQKQFGTKKSSGQA